MLFKEPNAVQLRVTLAEIEPPIWRRLVVPWTYHLGQLHLVIQAAFGWWNYHLHEFRSFDETQVQLLDFRRGEPVRFVYVYDFGDGWDHLVEFEDLLTLEPAPRVATCLDGARARPPEDVGGMPGYAGFLEILADPRHPEHREMKRWAGGHFDPEWFDRERCDREVRAALRPNRRIRLHQPAPSRRRRPRS